MPVEPFWYRNAVIYQMHVRSFCDSNGDGIGDFNGLITRLDYLEELGITAVWLLPFYPSPLKDDGYDIADYTGVNPNYGTIEDARRFIREAHRRGIRVITELVINHTSDQHPWFQRARLRPREARSATSTSGATATRNTPACASSSRISSPATGRTTASPGSTTGTASSTISRT